MSRFALHVVAAAVLLVFAACTTAVGVRDAGRASELATKRTVAAGYEFASIPGGVAVAGRAYSYTVQAAAEREPARRTTWTYSLLSGPAGMTISGNTVSWTPEDHDAGTHQVRVAATSGAGEIRVQRFLLTVNPPEAWRPFGMGGGGWIPAVAFSSTDPSTIYVGCDVGGFYRSRDGGLTWENRNSGLTDYYVQCLAVHPSDGDTVFAGTNSGVYRSLDGGVSWELKRAGFPQPREYEYSSPISALEIDASSPDVIYAGVGRPRFGDYGAGTVFRSPDGGETWTRHTAGLDPAAIITSIATDPADPGAVYAGTDRGVYHSTDGGVSWRRISRGLPHQHVSDIAVSRDGRGTLFAVLDTDLDSETWRGGIYRSDDRGQTWLERNDGLAKWMGNRTSLDTVSSYRNLVFDPVDPRTLYVADTSWGTVGIYRSTNGGDTWQLIMDVRERRNVDPGWITFFGPSPNSLAVDPHDPDHIVFGTDGQVLESRDGGGSWHPVYTRSVGGDRWATTGLETTCLGDIAVHPDRPQRVFLGYYDISLLRTDDAGESFVCLREEFDDEYRCNAFAVAIDPANPDIVYASGGPAGAEAETMGRVYRSVDGGVEWSCVADDRNGFPGGTVETIVIDPDSPADRRTIFATSSPNGVYKSIDGGLTWSDANAGLPRDHRAVSSLAIDPTDTRVLYVALSPSAERPGGLFRTTDGGAGWHRLPAHGRPGSIHAIAVDPNDGSVVYVGARREWCPEEGRMCPGGVYKSTDSGITWEHMTAALPDSDRVAVIDLVVDPRDSRTVYAASFDHPYHDFATGAGVLVSTDGGESWAAMNEGLPILSVQTIELDTATNTLYAGTLGSGVYVRSLSSP